MTVSIVIPTLDEASHLGLTLDSIAVQPGDFEVIVVDGGSKDGTSEIAFRHACPNLRLIAATRGRAPQMNAGAELATGQVLLFLHADTRLRHGALDAMRDALRDPGTVGGAFRLTFDESAPLLDFYATCSRIPWRHLCFGDRGIFVRSHSFRTIGGYPDVPIFEDLEIVSRIRTAGRFKFLTTSVVTSARRFNRFGHLRQQVHNMRLWASYVAGVNPHDIAHLYRYD